MKLLRRLSFYLVAAAFAVALNFALPRMMPGDAASALAARFQGQLRPEALSALRAAFGLGDEPLWRQFVAYLANLFRGELGTSIAYFPAPVSEVIAGGLGWTLFLSGLSLLLSFALGTLLGVVCAWRRGGLLDRLPPLLALIASFPYFWLAMAALYLFGFVLGWFPLRHAHSPELEPSLSPTFVADALLHAALPMSTVVLATLSGWVLPMRNTMTSVLGAEFVQLARAKGLGEGEVMLRHAARNALIPSVTSLGMALGFVVGGSLLTEVVFSYPGTGFLLVQAVRAQDYPLMQGLFLGITVAVLIGNLLVDLAVVWLDPRARGER
jgi:peptide/nickel transport system permease protein